MRCADDERCGARAASSERAGRTVPGPHTARNRTPSTAAETAEQTAVQGHEQTQWGAVPQLRDDGQRCLSHPWWRATPPWRWRTVTRWDAAQGRVVEKRVRAVRTPEQRERERRAKLEHKIAKYQAKREAQWQALSRPRSSITPLYDQFTERHAENRPRLRPLYEA
jgi:hypothetical protein